MSQNVYQFIDLQRVDPPKKPLKIRKLSLLKFTSRFPKAVPKAQADRCLSRQPILRVEMSGTQLHPELAEARQRGAYF